MSDRRPVQGTLLILLGLGLSGAVLALALASAQGGARPGILTLLLTLAPLWFVYRGVQAFRGAEATGPRTLSDALVEIDSTPNPVGQACGVCGGNMPFHHEAAVCRACHAMFHLRCAPENRCPECGKTVASSGASAGR